jgi:hypothetical protein
MVPALQIQILNIISKLSLITYLLLMLCGLFFIESGFIFKVVIYGRSKSSWPPPSVSVPLGSPVLQLFDHCNLYVNE